MALARAAATVIVRKKKLVISVSVRSSGIKTDRAKVRYGDKPELLAKYTDPRKVLLPESIAKVPTLSL